MPDMLEIVTFGGLQIRQGARPVVDLGARKAEALLVYLACSRRAQPRELLADLLWDDRPTSQALMDLRWPLSRLKARLGDYLIVTRTTVAFNPAAPYRLDVEAFEAALAGARAHRLPGDHLAPGAACALEAAAALYAGPFLQGFALRGGAGFDDWRGREQARLQQAVIGALHALVAAGVAGDDPARGIRAAARLLQLDPLHEPTHHRLMLLLARDGRRSAALEQYEICRRVLAAELGVAPDAETTALYAQIRAAGAPPESAPRPAGPPRPERLPQSLTPFVPRPDELAALTALLAGRDCRLITLAGPGGAGKTRLAIEAGRAAPGFAGGVVFVPLADVRAPARILPAVAAALDLPAGEEARLAARLAARLGDRPVLLILDNFEQLTAGATLLVDLLAAAPGLTLLVTARTPLNLAAEQIVDVGGLPVPPEDGGPDAASYPAVQLFVERARRQRLSFALGPGVTPWVVRICRLVDGLPLAVELAAVAVRARSCRDIAEALAHDLDALATTQADVPPRHRSLRAVFDQSWARLAPAEQAALARLAVFRGGWDAAAAGAVAGADAAILASLARGALLVRPAPERYTLHPLVRQYAEARLHAEPGAAPAARARHAAYYLALAEAAYPELVGPQQAAWLATLEAEAANLRAALAAALDPAGALRGGDTALRLATALNRFWYFRGYLSEGRAALEAALAATPAGADPAATRLRGVALNAAGSLAREQGDLPAARAALDAALALLRPLADPALPAAALNNLGLAARDAGDHAGAAALLGEALVLYEAAGDTRSRALVLNNLGKLAHQRGDRPGARRHYEASLALHAGLADRRGEALVLANLAQVLRDDGAAAEARARFHVALRAYVAVGDQRGATDCLEGLFTLAAAAPDAAAAARLYGAALALRERTGARRVPREQAALATAEAACRTRLAPPAWEAAVAAGRLLAADLAEAAAYAARVLPPCDAPPPGPG